METMFEPSQSVQGLALQAVEKAGHMLFAVTWKNDVELYIDKEDREVQLGRYERDTAQDFAARNRDYIFGANRLLAAYVLVSVSLFLWNLSLFLKSV